MAVTEYSIACSCCGNTASFKGGNPFKRTFACRCGSHDVKVTAKNNVAILPSATREAWFQRHVERSRSMTKKAREKFVYENCHACLGHLRAAGMPDNMIALEEDSFASILQPEVPQLIKNKG
jgi:hypothetical protein